MQRAAILLLLLATLPTAARADTRGSRLLFFGLRKGCEAQRDIDALVTDRLLAAGEELLSCEGSEKRPRVMNPDPSCSGAECAARLPPSCRQVPLRLVGGQLHDVGPGTVVRLWLAETGGTEPAPRTAFLDTYCPGCSGTALAEHIVSAIAELGQKTAADPAAQTWPARPGFCTPERTEAEPSPRKILVLETRASRREGPYLRVLREQLKGIGEDFLVSQGPGRRPGCTSLECLTALYESHRGRGIGRIMGVSEDGDGKLSLWVFDGATRRTATEDLACEACDERQRLELCARKVPVLAQACFDETCRDARRAQTAPPPPEACQPLSVSQCAAGGGLWKSGPYRLVAWSAQHPEGVDLQPGGGAAPVAPPARKPLAHRLAEGLLWTGTAAGIVATIGLLGANATLSCTVNLPVQGGGTQPITFHSNCLRDQTIVAGTFTAVSLLIALPLTIALELEQGKPRRRGK